MISVQDVESMIKEYLKDTNYQLVTLSVSPANEILVEVDRLEGVDLDFCASLNAFLNERLEKITDDYALEVGSVSLTAPFKTRLQYDKNLGHNVELLTKDGKKWHGVLVSVDEESFMVDVPQKKKEIQSLTFGYNDIKYIKYDLKI